MSNQTYISSLWRQFHKSKLAFASLLFVLFVLIVAIFAPLIANDKPLILKLSGKWYMPAMFSNPEIQDVDFQFIENQGKTKIWKIMPIVPYRPNTYDLNDILKPPSLKHFLGTDGNGRDVAAGIIWGARVSLAVGLVAVGLALAIGVILGAIAGFYGGWIDIVISRFLEIVMCFPTFFLILTILAFVGPSIYNVMAAIGITGFAGVARLVRGEFLKIKNREFVTAAVVAGASNLRLIVKHCLPASMPPVLVSASFGVAAAILAESALSFLGFGVPPTTPSWGSLLAEAQQFMDVAWWLTLAPGFAIFATIMAYNFVGEALRDAAG